LLDPHLTTEQLVALVRSYANYRLEPPVKLDALYQTLTKGMFAPEVLTAGFVLLVEAKQLPTEGVALLKRVLQADQPALHLDLVQALDRGAWEPALPLLVALVGETQRSIELRSAAAKALRHGSKVHVPTLAALIAKNEAPMLTIAMLHTLQTLDASVAQRQARDLLNAKDVGVLHEAIHVLSATPAGAIAAGEAFVRTALPRDVLPSVADGLRKHVGRDPAVTPLLTNVMKGGLLLTNNAAEVEKIRQLVISKGDAARGRALYLNANGLACVRCHQMEGVGGNVGPDLTRWWDTATIAKTIEALLEPSKTIAPAYRTVALTANGQTIHGRIISDTKDAIVLRDATGKDNTFPQVKIAALQPSAVSLMPAEVVTQLSFEQLIDLVAFLQNRAAQESLRGIVTRYRIAPIGDEPQWRTVGTQANGLLDLPTLLPKAGPVEAAFVVQVPKAKALTMYLSAAGPVTIWVNGKQVHERRQATDNEPLLLDLEANRNEVRIRFTTAAAGLMVRWQANADVQWSAE
jgi:putative heme-binding domain-containing protein